jgi:hypothetical protein
MDFHRAEIISCRLSRLRQRRGILRLRGGSSAQTRTRGEKSRLFAQNDAAWLCGDPDRGQRDVARTDQKAARWAVGDVWVTKCKGVGRKQKPHPQRRRVRHPMQRPEKLARTARTGLWARVLRAREWREREARRRRLVVFRVARGGRLCARGGFCCLRWRGP